MSTAIKQKNIHITIIIIIYMYAHIYIYILYSRTDWFPLRVQCKLRPKSRLTLVCPTSGYLVWVRAQTSVFVPKQMSDSGPSSHGKQIHMLNHFGRHPHIQVMPSKGISLQALPQPMTVQSLSSTHSVRSKCVGSEIRCSICLPSSSLQELM